MKEHNPFNGPAFTAMRLVPDPFSGMTKLEYFTACVMQGYCANKEAFAWGEDEEFKRVAEKAVKQAKVLIDTLNEDRGYCD